MLGGAFHFANIKKHSPYDVRIPPRAKHIIAGERKHDATLAADIDINRFGRRCWAELSI